MKAIHTFILLSEVKTLEGIKARVQHVLEVNSRYVELKEYRLLEPTIKTIEDAKIKLKRYNFSVVF